jgi:hopanoid biosynthesis associated RND transporter like protein HpnN
MLETLVGFCLRRPWLVVAVTLLLTFGGAYETVERFAIDTDTNHLFASNIRWRRNETELYKQFPQLDNLILAVIDGTTPQIADDAAKRLSLALAGKPLIARSWRPEDSEFFKTNGILFLDVDEIRRTTASLVAQREFLLPLAEDPTLRGLTSTLMSNMQQVAGSKRGMAMFTAGLDELTQTLGRVLAGQPGKVSWEKMLASSSTVSSSTKTEPSDLRRIVLIKPVIDFSELQPGEEAIALVRKTAADLGLTEANGVKLRLTGQVPLADDEFATISENMGLNLSVTLAIVALILFAALRSPKLILAVLMTLLAGLALTAGLGIWLIGRFNMISVAFAALFIGLGVDFSIQFTTRYREDRHNLSDSRDNIDVALRAAARNIGGSLTLAAVSLLAGFFCFLPTDFRGVSELGLIAGFGMMIAYVATLTFLPALIKLLNPAPEHLPIETASLAAIDEWIARHRAVVIVGSLAVTAAGAPALMHLKFDSNPMNLRGQKVESVATFLDLAKNPQTAPNTIEVLASSYDGARAVADRIAKLPEVDHLVMVDTLVPKDQDDKLGPIENAAFQLRGVFTPKVKPPPTDYETVHALETAAEAMRGGGAEAKAREAAARQAAAQERRARGRGGRRRASPDQAGPDGARAEGAMAQEIPESVTRFATALDRVAKADPETRERAQHAVFDDFNRLLKDLRLALEARRVTPDTIPEQIARDWISPSGKYRIEVFPKGDSNDRQTMSAFADALRVIAPDASGPPIVVAEAGKTVVNAFIQAGAYSFAAIFLILVVALRNPKHVALTLGPLVLAGILSLESADALGMSLNFANIIALPLMFAVGVAFHIYYVVAWRKGIVDMLASSLTRAIFFSALTTGTAFGSLIFSSHPGTASMGELLAISLFFTLLAAFIVVPAFLGPPPKHAHEDD